MVKKLEVYKCNLCGSMVETLRNAEGTLSCCGEPMRQLKENTVDAAVEKHILLIHLHTDILKNQNN